MLRNGRDTVNFFGLEITKTSNGFEMKNSTELVESLLNLHGLENSKPTANPGRCSTVVKLAAAILPDGLYYSNFRTAVGKLIFMAPQRPDMKFAIQQLSTQVLNPTTEEQARNKTVTQTHLSSSRTTHDGSKRNHGTCWSQWLELGQRFGNAPKGYWISLQCFWSDDVQQEPGTDSIQSQFLRSRILHSQCLRRRTVGSRRTLHTTSPQRFSSSRNGFRFGTSPSPEKETRRTQAH